MARHLSEAGYRIGLAASFDTHLPARQPETVNENRASDTRHKENMLARFALDMARLLGKDVNDQREEFLQLGYEQQFQFVQRMFIREGMQSQSSAHDEMTNLLDVFSRNSVAIDSYSLRPSEQSVVLFVAADNEELNYLRKEWELRTGRSVDIRRVPGHHYTMLRKPNVSILANSLGHLIASIRRSLRLSERQKVVAITKMDDCWRAIHYEQFIICRLRMVTSSKTCLSAQIEVDVGFTDRPIF